MIEITLNGQTHALPQSVTVAELVQQLGYPPRRVAVEVNREVVPNIRHAETPLRSGDAVEIVTLVGGGSGQESGGRSLESGVRSQGSGDRSQRSEVKRH